MSRTADVVIVGASLAGLRAAEALRAGGHTGALTLIGDEAHPPYDRPPLSKQVLSGWVRAEETLLPRLCPLDAAWRRGVAAVGLDRAARKVRLADGGEVAYERLIVATGARARDWPVRAEARLSGVRRLRTLDDAEALVGDLDARPRRVLVIGAGFTGSEVASACRDRGLETTVVELSTHPLRSALGVLVGRHAERLQRAAGVDLRCGVSVQSLLGDGEGRLRGARLSDGAEVAADLAVVCLGAVRNTEWLAGSGLSADSRGVLCDARWRALDQAGAPAEDIFACGDVARFRHPLAPDAPIALEHWGSAVEQAAAAAAALLDPHAPAPAPATPRFWSMQFGANFKSVGLPSHADSVVVAQGSADSGRFVAAYGRAGRLIGAIAVNQAQWLPFYEEQIEAGAPFPPAWRTVDPPPDGAAPEPADFIQVLAPA